MARKKRRKRPTLVSRSPGLVSGRVRLVSRYPRITIPRFWGVFPRWKRTELVDRRRELVPAKMGLLHFLITAPLAPLRVVSRLVGAVAEQAEEEREAESDPRNRLLELEVRHEAEQIGDEEFTRLKRELQAEIEAAEESEGPVGSGGRTDERN